MDCQYNGPPDIMTASTGFSSEDHAIFFTPTNRELGKYINSCRNLYFIAPKAAKHEFLCNTSMLPNPTFASNAS